MTSNISSAAWCPFNFLRRSVKSLPSYPGPGGLNWQPGSMDDIIKVGGLTSPRHADGQFGKPCTCVNPNNLSLW